MISCRRPALAPDHASVTNGNSAVPPHTTGPYANNPGSPTDQTRGVNKRAASQSPEDPRKVRNFYSHIKLVIIVCH